MKESYKNVLEYVTKLGGYAQRFYSRARSLSADARLFLGRYGSSHGDAAYGSSNIPANGGYDPNRDYERLKRRSAIIPELA